jgi:DHA1 family inner membrane transport protein
MGTSALAMIGAVTSIAQGLQLDVASVAGLVAVYAVVFAVSAPLLQVVAARLPRRSLILIGLALSAAGALGSACAMGHGTLLASRLLVALGGAAIGPVASALGASLVPSQQQGRALATVFSGMTMASVLSTPAAEWLAAQAGWRAMFLAVAALNALVAVALLCTVKDRSAGQPLSLSGLVAELCRPVVATSVAVMLFYMCGVFISFTLIVPLLQTHFELTREGVSMALLSFGLAGLAGNALAKRLAGRFSAVRLMAMSVATLVLVFVAMWAAPPWAWVAMGLMVVWAVTSDVFMPSQQRRLAEIAPHARGLVLALNASALYLGMSAGSLLAGVVVTQAGLTALPLASTAALVATLGMLALARRLQRRAVAQANSASPAPSV